MFIDHNGALWAIVRASTEYPHGDYVDVARPCPAIDPNARHSMFVPHYSFTEEWAYYTKDGTLVCPD